jgi:DAACS family dicarboxylate/amino acid:cation (Na+ or H+) symporter
MSAGHTVPHTRILIGLVGGAILGCTVNALKTEGVINGDVVALVIKYVTKPVGDIFLNLLFMAIIPLVFASIAVGVTRLGGGQNVGRIGLKTISYFLVTTACAAAIGLTLVNAINPGNQIPQEKKDELTAQYKEEAGKKLEKKEGDEGFGINTFVKIVPRYPLKALVENDMLAVIFTAIIVGIALTRMQPGRATLMIELLEGVNFIADFILRLAMTIAPYAVFCLIFSTTAALGYKVLVALAAFIFTVLGGLAIHLCVVLPILVKFLGGMSPVEFFKRARGTMVTAFSTSSSSATLPTAMKCAEEELGVPPTVSRFVLPLSASMNHNGTALFESVTVLFLAQAFGFQLDLGQQLMVLVLCILTATGMAGVPGGSLPLIGLILVQVGVPAGAIALVLGVDRILDMCRTMVNVTADLTTAVFVARSEPAIETRGLSPEKPGFTAAPSESEAAPTAKEKAAEAASASPPA